MIKITLLNDKILLKFLDPLLINPVKDKFSYTEEIWVKNFYGKKERKLTRKSFLKSGSGRNNFVLPLGFIDNLKEEFGDKFSEPLVNEYKIKPDKKPFLHDYVKNEDVVFREGQKRLILSAINNQKGGILAATGYGKTVTMFGIVSAFNEDKKWLISVPTKDLLYQTKEVAEKFGFKNVGMLGDGIADYNENTHILIGIGKSIKTAIERKDKFLFSITGVITDEAHLGSGIGKGQSFIIENLMPVMRFFVTATLPPSLADRLNLNAMYGKVIGEVTIQEAKDEGALTPLEIGLISLTDDSSLNSSCRKSYQDSVRIGIIENKERNNLIIKAALELKARGETVLILAQSLDQGRVLRLLFQEKYKLDVPYIEGATKTVERLEKKKDVLADRLDIIIASKVFIQGIDIPNLTAAVLAQGGKGETQLIQMLGRILRLKSGKTQAIVVDFVEKVPYQANHFASRMDVYLEQNTPIKKFHIAENG